MMTVLGKSALPALMLCVFTGGAGAQSPSQAGCTVDSPVFVTSAPNIFTDKQEQDLGDAWAEQIEPRLRLAPSAADDQVTRIGERLLATLSPTGIHYRFRIYDSGEINAFSMAGGRIYISRKLIAAVKNEDELAGVIAHEIGHISTHQSAIAFSRLFRIRLHVTSVTDRADIFAKVHQFENTPAKSGEEENTEEKGELAADNVALYALTRAGYAVESFPEFFNQVSLNKGKTGTWFSDVFGLTHEDTKRYRGALKLIDALPAGCKGRAPGASDAFKAWLKNLVDERIKIAAESVSGDRPLKLESPLRPNLWRIRFSPDGRYLLAQDEASITIVDRNASKLLFRIDAPDAAAAQFTPDSKDVVFNDSNLRVERWSIAAGQRTTVRELVVFDGCSQTLLLPDGKTLMCVNLSEHEGSLRVGLRLIDVETSKPFYEKPAFCQPNAFSLYEWYRLLDLVRNALSGQNIVNVAASPDGRYLIASVGFEVLAYDLEQRQPVKLGGKLKGLGQVRMSFLGPDRLGVVGKIKSNNMYQFQMLSFPDGRLIKEGEIGNQQFVGATKGELLIVWPLKDYSVGLFDPALGKLETASKLFAIDAWDNFVATENISGGISIENVSVPGVTKIDLPLGPLPGPKAAAFSPDGRFLAVSLRNRAEIWSLETGKQLNLIRPFQSAWISDADHLFGQFPKYVNWDPKELEFTMSPLGAKELAKLDDDEWQYRNLELRFKPLGKDKSTNRNITFEVKKMQDQTVAWSRDFAHERPACWPAEDDRMVLAWDLSSETAKDEIKKTPRLKQEAEAQNNHKKGLLIETVNPETGAPLEQVALPEVDLTEGWKDERFAKVSGEFVLVRGEHGNTVTYRLEDGAKVGEFFGWVVASDAGAGLVAAVNREDEVLLVDERTGKELRRFTLGSPVRLARIVGGKEKTLMILTADQVVHRLLLTQ
jgi:WD40 repeat protein